MFGRFFIFVALAHGALARTTGTADINTLHATPRSEGGGSFMGDLKYVYKVYQECSASDLTSCLKLKLVSAMDRVSRSFTEIPVFEGVKFVKDPKAVEATPQESKTEAEIEANLPRSLEDREDALNNMISEKVSNFIGSHTLQVTTFHLLTIG